MKKSNGDDYVCIAQTIQQDTVKAYDKKDLKRKELPLPSSNSLEAAFSKSDIKYGYIDAKELNEIVTVRMQGSHHTPLSGTENYINTKSQIKGVLFVN